jgi:hypothetical protein
MGRQIKSVSIPERLHERMKDIPNFSQWVIQALESEDGRTGAAIDRSAANRRRHIRDLEDIIEDLAGIAEDVKSIKTVETRLIYQNVDALVKAIEGVTELWNDTLAIRRKQA